jgi:hypothetical protein
MLRFGIVLVAKLSNRKETKLGFLLSAQNRADKHEASGGSPFP